MALNLSPRKVVPLASGDEPRPRLRTRSTVPSVTKRVFLCGVVVEGAGDGPIPEGTRQYGYTPLYEFYFGLLSIGMTFMGTQYALPFLLGTICSMRACALHTGRSDRLPGPQLHRSGIYRTHSRSRLTQCHSQPPSLSHYHGAVTMAMLMLLGWLRYNG